jgi:hypothetical protein
LGKTRSTSSEDTLKVVEVRELASRNSPIDTKTKAWTAVVGGYSTATLGLVALLTINGASGIPTVIAIGTAGLVAIGLLLPAAGMLQLRKALDQNRTVARSGLAMPALGLVGLLFGVIPLSSSLSGWFVVSAACIVTSGALALAGAFLLRGHYADIGATTGRGVEFLILGTTLIFSGVGLILGSNVAYYFFLSDVGNTVYTDVGAVVSACGCVIAAYSFFVVHARS